jgi:hypothetical protein
MKMINHYFISACENNHFLCLIKIFIAQRNNIPCVATCDSQAVSEMKLHISALRLAMSNISQTNTEVENFMRLFF